MNEKSDSLAAVPAIENQLIRAHAWAAMATLFLSAIFGTLVASKFNFPDFLGGDAWLTWGRLRYNHTQGIFFGWLGNAFLMFLYYAVPRLANRAVTSGRLGWWLFGLWNFAVVLPGWVLVAAGFSQPLEWAEFPLIVDAFVVFAFVLMLVQFVVPFLRANLGELYVSSWYIIGGLTFTLLAYPVGNIVPEWMPGAIGAGFSGLWIHDAIGLFATPLALAMAYFVIPATTRRPIYSHFLSMVGFWILFFIYPLNGTHHYVFSAIPMSAQKSAIVASIYLGMDVILVVTNLLLSLRGATALVAREVPLRFVWTGVVFYLLVSIQGAMQAVMPINRLLHFSDWVIGHSHLAMFGFATFIAMGAMAHVWQRTPGVRCNMRVIGWAYWLMLCGLGLMVIDLTAAGLVEGHLWNGQEPWLESVRAARGYWMVRLISALPSLAGFCLFWIGLMTGPRVAWPSPGHSAEVSGEDVVFEGATAPPSRRFGIAFVITFVAGVVFFALSFVALGILPGEALARQIAKTAPIGMPQLTASEERGRFVYGREGCAYCHTQQVRFLQRDVNRFGPPTEAWETKYDYPQLWGTRRVGPDLAREYGVRSNDWQLAHLYNPRLVIRDSVMPPYPWLFAGETTKPKQEALDLLAYVQSLGRARKLSGFDETATVGDMDMGEMNPHFATPAEANASAARGTVASPVWRPSIDPGEFRQQVEHGANLFAANCAACHGAQGKGDGAVAASLLPRPANLTARIVAPERLSAVLWNGVRGASMQAWRDLSQQDLQGLVSFLSSLPAIDTEPARVAADESEALFAEHCASCHGAQGEGDGVASKALAPPPANFRWEQPTSRHAREVLERGIAGTAMPPWAEKLTTVQRESLVVFVRSLYRGQGER